MVSNRTQFGNIESLTTFLPTTLFTIFVYFFSFDIQNFSKIDFEVNQSNKKRKQKNKEKPKKKATALPEYLGYMSLYTKGSRHT